MHSNPSACSVFCLICIVAAGNAVFSSSEPRSPRMYSVSFNRENQYVDWELSWIDFKSYCPLVHRTCGFRLSYWSFLPSYLSLFSTTFCILCEWWIFFVVLGFFCFPCVCILTIHVLMCFYLCQPLLFAEQLFFYQFPWRCVCVCVCARAWLSKASEWGERVVSFPVYIFGVCWASSVPG